MPLRLTARGHDFIADLRHKEVWQTIKTNFKDEGSSTLMELSKSITMGVAKKKTRVLQAWILSNVHFHPPKTFICPAQC
ncbi:hypothetical protein [Enterobacter sp. Bisph1]|uniref:DUF2513 domain-containing protein n=1 Tax=Enterobacter sp. Bisph1 TaxID=1274399 RepID=UPI00336A5790